MPAVTIIPAIPHCLTPEQHADLVSKTPENFDDIPPVVRCKREKVKLDFDPPVEGLDPSTKGVVYVISSVLAFQTDSGKSFQIEYPKITLHAVGKEGDVPYVYLQLDDADGADIPEDEDSPSSIIKLWPGTSEDVEAVFEALSQCAALHPDPATPGEDLGEDGDHDVFGDADASEFEPFTGSNEEELSEVGRVRSDFVNDNRYQPY